MKAKKTIILAAKDVAKIIKDLSLLIVSADHLGTAYYNQPDQLAAETEKYFQKMNAFKLLAEIRGVLSEAYESQSSKADVERLENEAEKLPYWKE